jgi:outer membrane receptor protein involved in Fe transport
MTRTTLGSWLFNFSGRLASSRQEFIYGDRPVTLDGYLTLDFYTEYRFVRKKGLRAFLDLRNLTNTRYEELRGYNARRFTLMTGLLLDR